VEDDNGDEQGDACVPGHSFSEIWRSFAFGSSVCPFHYALSQFCAGGLVSSDRIARSGKRRDFSSKSLVVSGVGARVLSSSTRGVMSGLGNFFTLGRTGSRAARDEKTGIKASAYFLFDKFSLYRGKTKISALKKVQLRQQHTAPD
jgi:hypothetical protein